MDHIYLETIQDKIMKLTIYFLVLASITGCSSKTEKLSLAPQNGKAVAVFASGCFWCTEHIFESIVGVEEAVSGYSGGTVKDPYYEYVSSNKTGHAESVAVFYDPKLVSYKELVAIFFASHDPTTPDQQGPDRGSSYRSVAFYENATEKKIIEDQIQELNNSGVFNAPIITEVTPRAVFYEAEAYHQNYVINNPNEQYVQGVSLPRYNKFIKSYKGKIKSNQ